MAQKREGKAMLFAIVNGQRRKVRDAFSAGPTSRITELVLADDYRRWTDNGVFYRRLPCGGWERCYPDGPGRYVTSSVDIVLDWPAAAGR